MEIKVSACENGVLEILPSPIEISVINKILMFQSRYDECVVLWIKNFNVVSNPKISRGHITAQASGQIYRLEH